MTDADFKQYSHRGISLFYQSLLPLNGNKENTINWLSKIIRGYNYTVSSLNYIFCSDAQLHKINLKHLNHDTYTDILTFDYSDDKNTLEGDIYISVERVRENAKELQKSFDEEFHRVLIHGVLHLIGYNDATEEEKKEMREKENTCLSLR